MHLRCQPIHLYIVHLYIQFRGDEPTQTHWDRETASTWLHSPWREGEGVNLDTNSSQTKFFRPVSAGLSFCNSRRWSEKQVKFTGGLMSGRGSLRGCRWAGRSKSQKRVVLPGQTRGQVLGQSLVRSGRQETRTGMEDRRQSGWVG